MCEEISGKQLNHEYAEANRSGDHIWWVSDNGRFKADYPNWDLEFNVKQILQQIHDQNVERWTEETVTP
jgi:CDP-paratose 2-epimerase